MNNNASAGENKLVSLTAVMVTPSPKIPSFGSTILAAESETAGTPIKHTPISMIYSI
jgi:hypothetical protein